MPDTPSESRVTWGSPSDKAFPHKIKAWDEGYAFALSKIERDLAPVAVELFRAMMGDSFDADKASQLPSVLSLYGITVEDFYYE